MMNENTSLETCNKFYKLLREGCANENVMIEFFMLYKRHFGEALALLCKLVIKKRNRFG